MFFIYFPYFLGCPKNTPLLGTTVYNSLLILVGIVLVLGIVSAVYSMTSRPQVVADADTSDWGFMDASRGASQPVWYVFLVPLVGALGVLWGGRLGYPESSV